MTTTTGPVVGRASDGIDVFRGIPYGATTAGAARFRAPEPPAPWTELRDAGTFGPSCPQAALADLGDGVDPAMLEPFGMRAREERTSEDCLVLNVWSPSTGDGRQRPVMVWLHGGGWSTGSASWPLYDFANLARGGDIVVVSVNHRLGVLGFLRHNEGTPAEGAAANAGLLDLVLALEWVRDNVDAFGGDPNRVTLVGESGGGMKISMVLAMPQAAGLFHGAVVMSGAALLCQEPALADRTTSAVVEQVGVADASRLRDVPVDALIAADAALMRQAGDVLETDSSLALRFGPVRDETTVPRNPIDAIADGASADVPLLIGCTTDETIIFMRDPALWSIDDDGLQARLTEALGDDATMLVKHYRSLHPEASATDLYAAITADHRIRIPTTRLAQMKSAASANAPVFMYQFGWGPAIPGMPRRAAHGTDMPFFFDNMQYAFGGDDDARELSAAMSQSLVNFVRSGDPNGARLPEWPRYDGNGRMTMVFDSETRVVSDPAGAERTAWDGVAPHSLGLV